MAMAGASLAMLGCGRSRPSDDTAGGTTTRSNLTSAGITLFVPVGLQTGDIAVAATRTLTIDDRAQVQAGTGSAGAVVQVGPTTAGSTTVRPDAVIPTLWSAAPATLSDRVHVLGPVFSNAALTEGSSVVVSGAITSAANTVRPRAVSWSVILPTSPGGAITVNAGQSTVLGAGRYGSVTVNSQGTLTLSAGVYVADSLTLNAAGTIKIDDSAGPVSIYVLSSLTDHGTLTGKASATPKVVLAYLGSSAIVFDSSFSGSIVAPFASVTYRPSVSTIVGGIFAQDVEIGAGVIVKSQPSAALAADIGGTGDVTRLTPILDGLASIGTTTYAVFGYKNTGTQNLNVPYGPSNGLATAAGPVLPAAGQPVWFSPGTHHGALVAALTTASLKWTLGAGSVTATAAATQLTVTSGTGGQGVTVGGTFIVVQPSPDAHLQGSIVATHDSNNESPISGPIPFAFDVGPDGAAIASIPIWVPPGRAGMQPTIALNYSSNHSANPDGLGTGWSIAGTSAITRCPHTYASDNTPSPVNFSDPIDGLCLDGQRLILQGGTFTEGSVYHTERETFVKVVQHLTNGLISSFDVFLKDGRKLTYGGGTSTFQGPLTRETWVDSATDKQPPTTVVDPINILSWSLNTVSDRAGNTLTYNYSNVTTSGNHPCNEHHLTSITYGTEGLKSVVFSYTPTSDVRTSFVKGFCIQSSEVLTEIDAFGPRPEVNDPNGLLRQYQISADATGVTGVVIGDGLGDVQTLELIYQREQGQLTEQAPANIPSIVATATDVATATTGVRPLGVFSGDFNGDGADDIMYWVPVANTNPQQDQLVYKLSNHGAPNQPVFGDQHPVVFTTTDSESGDQLITCDSRFHAAMISTIDFTSDGLADMAFNNGEIAMNVGISSNGSLRMTSLTNPTIVTGLDGPLVGIADINGDGLPEAAARIIGIEEGSLWTVGGANVQITSNNDISFPAPVGPPIVTSIGQSFGTGSEFEYPFHAGHFRDAGTTAILVHGTGAPIGMGPKPNIARMVAMAYDTSIDLAQEKLTTTGTGLIAIDPSIGQYAFPDLNGDGLSDAVLIDSTQAVTSGGGVVPSIYINTGAGFRFIGTNFTPTTAGLLQQFATLVPIDFDQDGLEDLLVLRNLNFNPEAPVDPTIAVPGQILFSNGNGFRANGSLPTNPELGRQPFHMLDFDGDGLQDFLAVDPQHNIQAYRHTAPRAPLLKQIFDSGMNRHIDITYAPFSKVSTPTILACSYPLFCPKQGIWVVSEVDSESQTVPGSLQIVLLTDTYSYAGARNDLRGRGWLGMESRTITRTRAGDPTTPVSQEVTTYDNTDALLGTLATQNQPYVYPRIGLPQKVQTTRFNVGTDAHRNDIVTRATGYGATQISGAGLISYLLQLTLDLEQVQETDAGPNSPTRIRVSTWSPMNYDAFGNLKHAQLSETLVNGAKTSMTVDATYMSDDTDWLISQPLTRTVTSTADGLTATRSWAYTPDPATGIIKHVRYQDGVPDEQVDMDYVRNSFGLPNSITSTISTGETRQTGITYDTVDGTFPATVTNALGQVTTLTYHPGYGVLVSSIDQNNLPTTASYDELGRIRSLKDPDGTGAQVHYEIPEVLQGASTYQTRVTSDAGGELKVTHDLWNRVISASTTDFTGAGARTIRQTFDPTFLAAPARIQVPSLTPDDPSTPAAQFTYDNAENLFDLVMPNNGDYTFGYNETTDGVVVISSTGGSHTETSDGDGRVTSATDSSLNATTHYTYGPFGLLHTATDGKGNVTTIGRDASGRQISLDDPNGGHNTMKWNGFDDLVQVTDGDNQVTTNVPDALGRIAQSITPEGTVVYNWDVAANGIGSMGSTTSPDNVDCTYSYDNFGRAAGQSWTLRTGVAGADGTYSLRLSYDAQGRPSVLTYPSVAGQTALKVQMTYAPNGEVSGVIRLPSNTPLITINSRDARGNVTKETAGNGVVTTHDYEVTTGLLHEIKSTSGSTTLRDLTYAYDGGTRLNRRTTDGSIEQFGYDPLDRLTSWEQGGATTNPGVAFNYDILGNTLSQQTTTFTNHVPGTPSSTVSFTPGDGKTLGPNQIATSSLGTYGYDSRGDQKTAPNRTVQFNSFGLPHTVTENGTTTTFFYDASDNRVLKTNGQLSIVTVGGLFERRIVNGSATDVFYVYDGERTVAQIVWVESGNSVTEHIEYFHEDHLQSIESITDAAGKIVSRQGFTPFGKRIGIAPADVRLGFDGLEQDDDLGLVNMGSRLYDPAQARFINADGEIPDLFSTQDFNRYAFVRNNPLSFRDPAGADGQPVPQQEDPEDPEPMDPLPSTDQSGTVTTADGAGNWTTFSFNDDSQYMGTVNWGGPQFAPGIGGGGGPQSGSSVPTPGAVGGGPSPSVPDSRRSSTRPSTASRSGRQRPTRVSAPLAADPACDMSPCDAGSPYRTPLTGPPLPENKGEGKPEGESHIIDNMSRLNDAVGNGAALREFTNVAGGRYRGPRGIWHTIKGAASKAKEAAIARAEHAHAVGNVTFFLGTIFSLRDGYEGYKNGDQRKSARALLDLATADLAYVTGVFGAIGEFGYWVGKMHGDYINSHP